MGDDTEVEEEEVATQCAEFLSCVAIHVKTGEFGGGESCSLLSCSRASLRGVAFICNVAQEIVGIMFVLQACVSVSI